MADVDLPPDDYVLDILNWLQFEIYPGLLHEPWTDRANAVWVSGTRGFIGMWVEGYARELPPAERLEAIRQELYRRIYAVKFQAPPEPPVTAPPLPGPIGHRRIVGQLRRHGTAFADDNGLILPLFWHFGEAFSLFVRRRDDCLHELDDIVGTGYHGIRFWDVLGYYDKNRPGDAGEWQAWFGKEVTPVRFTAFSGRSIEPTPHYYDLLAEFLRACRQRGLVVQHDRGDMVSWTWDQIQQHAAMVGDVQRSVGVTTIGVNAACNESWQNGVPEPERLKAIIERIGNPQTLCGSSAADDGYGGELPESVQRFTVDIGMSVHIIHCYRGGESYNRIGHIHAVGYETLPHHNVPGWQSEPPGAGDGVSVGREESTEALCLLGAMALCTRQGYVGMSGAGVFYPRSGTGHMATMKSYRELARVPGYLPQDIMTWPRMIHGGERFRGERVIAAHPGDDPSRPFYRADQFLRGNDFVCIIYGEPASHRVPVERTFEGVIITPETGERHPFRGDAGRVIDIAFERGRIIVGKTI